MSNIIEENEFSIDEARNTEQAAKGINKNGENFWFWYIRIRKIAGKKQIFKDKKDKQQKRSDSKPLVWIQFYIFN